LKEQALREEREQEREEERAVNLFYILVIVKIYKYL
jgi:hypothetical protein